MLTKPNISEDTIITCLADNFGLHIAQVTFLPLGYEGSAVYRVSTASSAPFFLKIRQGNFDHTAVDVSAFLSSQGIRQVMAPIKTTANSLFVREHDFYWTLYPFFEGKTGFEMALSKGQWTTLGQSVKAIHTTILPTALAERVPQEDYSPGKRHIVKRFLQRVEQVRFDDPIAAAFAALLRRKRDEIELIVERAAQLAQALQFRRAKRVVCHADLHGGNILVGADDALVIVDWDEPILAPKERDLMFVGGGVGGIWNNPQEKTWFYQGYGPTKIDQMALAYYRYERIVADVAACSEQIFGMRGSIEGRQRGLRLIEQFLPNNVVEIAHSSYQYLSETAGG